MTSQLDAFSEPNPFIDDKLGEEKLEFQKRSKRPPRQPTPSKSTPSLFTDEGIAASQDPKTLRMCKDFGCGGEEWLKKITELTAEVNSMRTFMLSKGVWYEFEEYKRTILGLTDKDLPF